MITIRHDKELVFIESWSEIESRIGFVRKLETTEHKLHSIIGSYQFKSEIHCGLASCNQPHAKGYIVATDTGLETNIGNLCGKRYFGIDFETQTKQFDRDLLEQENRKTLWAFRERQDEIYARIAELRQEGMEAVYKRTRPLLGPTKECPYEIVRRIAAMIKSRNPILTMTREATADEIESIEVREARKLSRPHYIEEPIAEIAGLSALYPENDRKQLVIMDLQVKLDQFCDLDIDRLTYEELKRWVKWANTVEPTFARAREIVGHGRKLLNSVNLAPLLRALERTEEIAMFRAFLKKLRDIPFERTPQLTE